LRGTRTKVAAKRRAGLDAIVVGAGVAGSALAYTLGKVILSSALAPSPSSMWPH
jgi:ribulose 1,5-bisphosphate synthetase/thiazole synthase